MTDIEPMNLESEDLVADRIEQLKALFPEISTEGSGSIDFEKFRLILGDEVNEDDERYGFTWPGKRDAIRQSQTSSSGTLRPIVDESRSRDGIDGSFDSDNLYIEGENLEVLKLLQHSYHGKVKLIYIDPPYNTGHDFVYKDSTTDKIANYKRQANLSGQSNAATNGRFHSLWCTTLYPRLKLARELLTEDGIFVASIDEHERLNLQSMLNEVFGEANYAGEIIWKNSSKNDQRYISVQHEYMLVYVKDKSLNAGDWLEKKPGLEEIYKAFDGFRAQYGKDWKAIHKAALEWYKQFPPSNPISDSKHYSWMDEKGVYFPADISGPNHGQYVYDVIHPTTKKIVKAPASGWRYPEPEMLRRIEEGLVHFGDDETVVPNNKTYLKSTETQSLTSIVYRDGRVASKKLAKLFGDKVFSNPKDDDLLKSLFKTFGISNHDIVMDFFSGSSSTAEAIMRMDYEEGFNTRWIMVQIQESLDDNLRSAVGSSVRTIRNAIDYLEKKNLPHQITKIAEERIRLSGDELVKAHDTSCVQLRLSGVDRPLPDIGFRVFKLDESGIRKQDRNAAAERGKLFGGDSLLDSVVKTDRSDMDIIFEMMLKWGLELTLPVEKTKAAGYSCYVVAGGELVCCMEAGLAVEALEAIAEMEPRRVLMLDSILTDTLKLNAVQIFKRVGERTGVEVELRTV